MDVELILNKMQDMGLIKLGRITGDYYQVHCPIHNNGQERKPSCGVLLREQYKNGKVTKPGFVHCFSCGLAKPLPEVITMVLKQKQISQSGLEWLKENIPGFEEDSVDIDYLLPPEIGLDLMTNYGVQNFLSMLNKSKQEYVSEEELASYRFTVPYMYQRGLTDEIIEKFDIGYDANFVPPGRKNPVPCITFPVRDLNGNTLFLCRRSIVGKMFNYPQGVEKSVYGIYECPKDAKSVIICESCLNALKLIRFGYNAVALLGTGTSYEINQLRQLGVSEFILCLDGDEAGHKGAEKLKRALSKVALVWTIHMPLDKDANDCTEEEFREFYNLRD